jgi:hypothetical protein
MFERLILGYSVRETVKVLTEYFLKYRNYKAIPRLEIGFADHEKNILPRRMVERIIAAYTKAKEDKNRTLRILGRASLAEIHRPKYASN